jgi:hypothetical protein
LNGKIFIYWRNISFFLVGLEFELRVLSWQSRCFSAWAAPPVHFVLVVLEMESFELSTQADLDPPDLSFSSRSWAQLRMSCPSPSTRLFKAHRFSDRRNKF